MTVNSGSIISSKNGYLGYSSAGTGTATITGAGSTWNVGAGLVVGYNGTGTLSILNHAAVVNSSGVWSYIAENTGSAGTVTVDGGSKWTSTGQLTVGNYGVGKLYITNGGTVTNGAASISSGAGSSGSLVSVDGAGSIWTINSTGNFLVGAMLPTER